MKPIEAKKSETKNKGVKEWKKRKGNKKTSILKQRESIFYLSFLKQKLIIEFFENALKQMFVKDLKM
jgi:hypothetical protein